MSAFKIDAPIFDIDTIVLNTNIHIIVCTGAGGVGKTTAAAALALRAAEHGRKVCVLTIDPARRLAQALGVVKTPTETPSNLPSIEVIA